jgi:Kef-type K+ transport system membrane component KefB
MDPLEAILVPIFFVLIGLQVKLESFLSTEVWLFASGLTVAAIIGKLVCGMVAGRGLNRLAIGIGMMPRGEVGLIFASIGKGLGVIDSQLFSAIVLMVVLTTVISPSLLKWSLRRGVSDDGIPESTPRTGG